MSPVSYSVASTNHVARYLYTPICSLQAACRTKQLQGGRGSRSCYLLRTQIHKWRGNQQPAPSTQHSFSPQLGAAFLWGLSACICRYNNPEEESDGWCAYIAKAAMPHHQFYQLIKGSMLERYLPHSSISPALDRVQANNGSRHAVSNVYY